MVRLLANYVTLYGKRNQKGGEALRLEGSLRQASPPDPHLRSLHTLTIPDRPEELHAVKSDQLSPGLDSEPAVVAVCPGTLSFWSCYSISGDKQNGKNRARHFYSAQCQPEDFIKLL